MEKVYLFDVDGTLTAPLSPIDEEFASIFLDWMESGSAIVYLVSGSDIKKLRHQLFDNLIKQCAGVFCCSGNQLWQEDKVIFQKTFRAPRGLIKDLNIYLEEGAQYNVRTGNHIERRPGMINFSVLGRHATAHQRATYVRWDKGAREREDIVEYITDIYPQLDVAIGGEISVDIYPKGNDKSQVVSHLRQIHGEDISMIFVGDRNVPGGNDWPLAQALETDPNSHWFQVASYEETRALIEHSELFIGEGGV